MRTNKVLTALFVADNGIFVVSREDNLWGKKQSVNTSSLTFSLLEVQNLYVILLRIILQVGIHWAERSDEYGMTEVVVSKMHLDGPADRSGKIQEGDVLIAVEGESVSGKGLAYLANKIPGPLNSIVKLTFNRGK